MKANLCAPWYNKMSCYDASSSGLGVCQRPVSIKDAQRVARFSESWRFKTEAAINAAANVGITGKEPTKAEVNQVVEANAAEKKLQMLVAETVAKQEKDLGFKFEEADVVETEKILRNK